ncbi:unnamed protein product [Rotaria magnacalcarata]
MWYSVASPMNIRGKPSSINQHNERSMTTYDVANICDTWIRTIYSIKLRQKRDNTSSIDIKVLIIDLFCQNKKIIIMGNFNNRVPDETYTNPSDMKSYDVIKHVSRDAEPGDMIQYHRRDYEHWAIYIGNGKVIQATVRDFSNTFMNKFMPAMLTIITFGHQTTFARITEESFHGVLQSDGVARINNFKDNQWKILPKNEIVERARMCVGRYPYHVLSNNCEHLVTWCRYGRRLSGQEEAFWSMMTFGIYKRK